jgi:hypothetical protein
MAGIPEGIIHKQFNGIPPLSFFGKKTLLWEKKIRKGFRYQRHGYKFPFSQ